MVNCRRTNGFTLLEMLISIVVMAVIGAVTLPVMMSATDAFVESSKARRIADDAAFAIERCTRLLRDIPAGEVAGEIAIATARSDGLRLSDARGFELVGTELLEWRADGSSAVLCQNVEELSLTFLDGDGLTSTLVTPKLTQRIHLSLTVDAFHLQTVIFPRVRIIPL